MDLPQNWQTTPELTRIPCTSRGERVVLVWDGLSARWSRAALTIGDRRMAQQRYRRLRERSPDYTPLHVQYADVPDTDKESTQ